jgi:hypothetical protein
MSKSSLLVHQKRQKKLNVQTNDQKQQEQEQQ